MSFAATNATRNEGLNFHIGNRIPPIFKVCDSRSVCVVYCDTMTVLTNLCPQLSSSSFNIKHGTSTV